MDAIGVILALKKSGIGVFSSPCNKYLGSSKIWTLGKKDKKYKEGKILFFYL